MVVDSFFLSSIILVLLGANFILLKREGRICKRLQAEIGREQGSNLDMAWTVFVLFEASIII